MNRKITKCLAAVMLAVTMLAANVFANENKTVDWSKGVIRATGVGAGKENASTGLKRAQAKRAATMDAQRNLAESVKGVHVTSESTMEDMMLQSDIVRTRVDTIISGMSEVDSKYFEDELCEVTLEMPMFGSPNALSTAAFLPYKDQKKVPFPQPTNTEIKIDVKTAVGGAYDNQYTGLIIECGNKINPVMSPVIKNSKGQSIYGHENLDIEKVIELGMASYASKATDDVSRERAGRNPLVVKAVKLDGFNSNPVVSVNDADKILIANQADQFLDNCAVVFVK